MYFFFVVAALVGGLGLALQIVLGLFGADHHDGDFALGEMGDGLHLLSVRSLSAGATFSGLTGMAMLRAGFGPIPAIPAAGLAGLGAAAAVAWSMRWMLRAETDGTVRLEAAVGQTGSVYLGLPGGGGAGKVHLTLQGQLVECQAVSREPLPTGSSVLVIDVVGPETVEVVPSSQIGVSHA